MAAPVLTQMGEAQLAHAVRWALERGATPSIVETAFMAHVPAAVERALAYRCFARLVHPGQPDTA